MNKKDNQVIEIPPGLSTHVARLLSSHIGRNQAILGDELTRRLQSQYPRLDQRVVREAIHQLRRDGMLICAAPGASGGYYVASSWSELEEFASRELRSRAMDLLETEKRLLRSAERQFGPQPNLF